MTEIAPFANEPVLELRRAEVRARLAESLRAFDASAPRRVPVWIGTDRRSEEDFASIDPGAPRWTVAVAAAARADEVEAAVALAARAAASWASTPARERASVLFRAAEWVRARRLELAALEVRECAKPWTEADADVCEAIDYLEYYGRCAIELDRGRPLLSLAGERNEQRFRGRGVAAVIAPWNFPIAIAMGMTAGALVAGNAVVLKPAEQSPGCGAVVVEALRAGGAPPEALALLPGDGAVGAALVAHPEVTTIAFTGSLAVGEEILATSSRVAEGQRALKRVVAELGGKNCIVVDADADLDEAVPAIVTSAFAYAGQKCSACSRVIVHDAVADRLAERLGGAVALLRVGQAEHLATDVPPVIEDDAVARIARYGAEAAREGRVLCALEPPAGEGFFVGPMLVSDLPQSAPVLREEVFGPLLTLERAASVDEAFARLDELSYALTAGLFSRNPITVERFVTRAPAGNLYVNRPVTGAMVGRQPFGGNRLSGSGTKAGGPDYLLAFSDEQIVSENTMRHGLPT